MIKMSYPRALGCEYVLLPPPLSFTGVYITSMQEHFNILLDIHAKVCKVYYGSLLSLGNSYFNFHFD